MVERGRTGVFPDLCLRNQYPPHVADMPGRLRVLANYAWEESGFPADWVDEFNVSLDLVTVTSAYVAKILRDNGVHVPIHVVGNAVDHILAERAAPPVARDASGVFRFLHVSSGFPRKGLDVLLAAWGAAFTRRDAVALVIKTFPNIHNRVEAELAEFRAGHPDAAPITLINAELDPAAMSDLYDRADALVCPSRGEGFGLPLAEAMALGKPVITTAYGGQSDFCTADTAWLCDYSFAYARTHLDVFDSVWVEPDPGSLARVLRDIVAAGAGERARLAEAGRARLLSHFTWDQVAHRTARCGRAGSPDGVRGGVSPAADRPGIELEQSLRHRCLCAVAAWRHRSGAAARVRPQGDRDPPAGREFRAPVLGPGLAGSARRAVCGDLRHRCRSGRAPVQFRLFPAGIVAASSSSGCASAARWYSSRCTPRWMSSGPT